MVKFRATNMTGYKTVFPNDERFNSPDSIEYKEVCFLMIKGLISKFIIWNLYVPNNSASRYIKQKLAKLNEKRQTYYCSGTILIALLVFYKNSQKIN